MSLEKSKVTRCAESFLIVWKLQRTATGLKFTSYFGSLPVNLEQFSGDFPFECQYTFTSLSISLRIPDYDTPLKRDGIHCKVKVYILDTEERHKHVQIYKLPMIVGEKYIIWNLERNVFKEEHRNLLSNNSLAFCVTITDNVATMKERYQLKEKSCQTYREMDDVPCLDSLSGDFRKLLLSGSEHDVTVKAGCWQFPAHKTILSSRSDVFSAIFRSKVIETKDGVVGIEEDVEPLYMEQFLVYLYTGKADNLTEESAMRLYEIADKYAVDSLIKKCSNFLVEVMTPKNACRCLLLADTHKDRQLKESAMSFIIQRDDIMNSRMWTDFSTLHPKLGMEVFKAHYQAGIKNRMGS